MATVKPRSEDDYIYPTFLGLGAAHFVAEPEKDEDAPVGRLIVPDPEQRHGWREHYVRPVPRAIHARRPIGFRRP